MSDVKIRIGGMDLDGTVYLNAVDLTKAIRDRADQIDARAAALGGALTPRQFEEAVALRSSAAELRGQADWIDVAVINFVTPEGS